MVKSIIDIQVNDQAFQNFQRLFQQYQRQLGATPLSWRQVAIAQQQGIKGFRDLVAEQLAAIGRTKMLAEAQAAANRLTRTNADAWRDMARSTLTVASNIKESTTQLLKWTSLTTVFSGLIGAGGLFGINRLAENTAGGRRSALGLGLSFGQQRSFQNAFGRVTDPDNLLSSIDTSLRSAAGKASLFGVGLNRPGDLSGNTADVAVRFLERARQLARSSDPQFDAETMRARGIDRHISLQDFQRLRNTPDQEFQSLLQRYRRNVGAFGASNADQRGYQEFLTTLDEAQNKISAVFIKGIAPLIPGLEKLSTAAADVIKAILGNEGVQKGLDEMGKQLKEFADYAGKPEFMQSVKDFVSGTADLAEAVKNFVKFVKDPLGATKEAVVNDAKREWNLLGADFDRVKKFFQRSSDALYGPGGKFGPEGPPAPAAAPAAGGIPTKSNAGLPSYITNGTGEIPVKPGAGFADPRLMKLADDIYRNVPGISRATAFNDDYHAGTNSLHAKNRAFDITLKDASLENYARTAEKVRAELRRQGIDGRVIDEANHPSSRATASHLHVEVRRVPEFTVNNAAGSSIIVSGGQLGTGGNGL